MDHLYFMLDRLMTMKLEERVWVGSPACYVPGNFSIKHNDGVILLDLAGEVYGRVLAVRMIVLTTVFSQIE